ncbi:MAG: PD40 domain-containing protein [Acidobacteria bacterium]|uniref:PD40 domain-containing protein n=1 Tax=Candidatus Polarisedimenticola svalbardensis TaxID=2886004 RepID=A0A8J6XUG5_9BACT|nr:PD40 domain-containing protein [Candidatus Polarisedimenticola svalbardensis]
MSTDLFGSNPDHCWQLASWDAVSGLGSAVTSFTHGVGSDGAVVSVSDDGQWLGIISSSDPLGQNHDGSQELFVMHPDGSGLAQLTDDPAPNAPPILSVAMAGSGSRLVFLSSTDPLGTNPAYDPVLFAVDRDGTDLLQLTTVSIGETGLFAVSDDGLRIVFTASGDPLGANADGGREIFAMDGDGTGLRQLTASSTGNSERPVISGDGTGVAFQSSADLTGTNPGGYKVFTIRWDGTALTQVTPSDASATTPSITDDGGTVFYGSNREIWSVASDGTGVSQLTTSSSPLVNRAPVVSGDGSRIVFEIYGGEYQLGDNPDGGAELMAMNSSGAGLVQLTSNDPKGARVSPEITPDGSRIVFEAWELYRVQADGSDLFQVIDLGAFPAENPGVSGDGLILVFDSVADPLGQNPGGEYQVFSVNADGSGLRQLTPEQSSSCGSARHPVIATDGSWVVFQSCNNYSGGNWDRSAELFRVRPDGTGLSQITDDDDPIIKWPRVNATGNWITYQQGGEPGAGLEIYRIRTDGTGLQQIATDPVYGALTPDISGIGDRIVYASAADPLGTNPDHNWEIFLWREAGDSTSQMTTTTSGDNFEPRISRDGRKVFFKSSSPLFEDNPTGMNDAYRIDIDTDRVERAGGVRRYPSDLPNGSLGNRYYHIATDETGDHAVFAGSGNWELTNPDYDRELFLVDYTTPARITVGKDEPTLVSWDAEPSPLRYDLIRGDLAGLAAGSGGAVDLGTVLCIEDDSPDTNNLGHEDPDSPVTGEAFFYLYRGSQGLNDGPGSFGAGSGGGERTPASGDCPSGI